MSRHTNADAIRYNCLTSEINALYNEVAVKIGISDSVLNILYVVLEHDAKCLQADIVRESGISRQTINSAIRNLEKDKLVYLEQGHGRNTIVCLTDKGKSFCDEKIATIFLFESQIYDSWTEEERRIYLNLTQRYLNSLREKIKGM